MSSDLKKYREQWRLNLCQRFFFHEKFFSIAENVKIISMLLEWYADIYSNHIVYKAKAISYKSLLFLCAYSYLNYPFYWMLYFHENYNK